MPYKSKIKKAESQACRAHVKKGDLVQVIAGRDKGKQGRVLRVVGDGVRVIVEKVSFIKRHTKPNQKVQQGGIMEKESPLSVSNVMLVCPRCNRMARQGKKKLDDGSAVRVCMKCKEVIDG